MGKIKVAKKKEEKRVMPIVAGIIFVIAIVSVLFVVLSNVQVSHYEKEPIDYEAIEESIDTMEIKRNVSIDFLTEMYHYEVLEWHVGQFEMSMAQKWGFTNDTNCYPFRGSDKDVFEDMDICWSNYTEGYITMKALGSRRDQVTQGLISFAGVEDLHRYTVEILTQDETCIYYVPASVYDAYLHGDLESRDLIDRIIERGYCH